MIKETGPSLMREWGCRENRVSDTGEGLVVYEGQSFNSLTSVARQITGSDRSGPMFFGLGKGGSR